MDDLWHVRCAVVDTDDSAYQATHQRLLRVFRREEEEGHRRRLLYGDAHIERSQELSPRPN